MSTAATRRRLERERSRQMKAAQVEARLAERTREENTVRAFKASDDFAARARTVNRSFTVVLFAVVTIALLIVLTLGVNIYRSTVVADNSDKQMREGTSLIATSIAQLDQQDCVSVGQGPEGDSLVLTERVGDQAFETRFYLSEGRVVQEYVAASSAYNPEFAQLVCESDTFEVELQDRMITITTDAGAAYVTLRSNQGGER